MKKNAAKFTHPELDERRKSKLVFASYTKKLFYLRFQISGFILLADATPFNPYMNFEYNLSGTVDKKLIRVGNNTMVEKSDELWVFGPVSDGVLVEVFMAKRRGMPIRFFEPHEDIGKFREKTIGEVALEDVSAWMWECVLSGGNLERWHPRLRFKSTYPIVYPAYSKRNFYWQMHISKFCIEKNYLPLNPFMLFRYFLSDLVPRKKIYQANAKLVEACDELWTFGEVSNGVLAEMKLAQNLGKKIIHYKITDPKPEYVKFRQIQSDKIVLEEEYLRAHL